VASNSGNELSPYCPHRRRWLGAIAVTLALISALSLSGVNMLHSSVMFNDILPASGGDRATSVLGHARFVRGDEFLVETPTALGQARSGRRETLAVGFAEANGSRQDADVHAYAPGPLASMFFRPLNLWFLIFSPEAAVIARQWSVLAISLAAFGLFIRVLMPGLRRRAIGGLAIAAVFSPPMMWWLTTTHHLAVGFALLSAVLLVVGTKRKSAAIAAAASGYLGALGAMTTYPAFFLSGVIVSVLCVLPTFLRKPDRILRIGIAATVAGVSAASFWFANRTQLQAVLATVYPGRRVSSSGGDSLVRAMTGPFVRFLTDDRPNGMGNQTELSSPIYLFPAAFLMVAAMLMAKRFRGRPRDRSFRELVARSGRDGFPLGALAGIVVLGGWAFGLVPTPVGRLIGLGGVPGGRTIMGLLIASTAIGAWVVARPAIPLSLKRAERDPGLVVGLPVVILVVLGVLMEGLALRRRVGPSFLAWREVFGYSALFSVCVLGVVLLKSPISRAWVAAGLALALTAGVHPVSIGLGQLAETSANLRAAFPPEPNQPNQANQPNQSPKSTPARWAAHADVRLNAVVAASGLPSLSGVYFVPDQTMWRVLDPGGRRRQEWNRYAHVVFRFGVGPESQKLPEVTAVQLDAIIVDIGLCRPELATLGLRYVVSTAVLDAPCVRRRTVVQPGNLHVAVLR
jgi:hypothetical protein